MTDLVTWVQRRLDADGKLPDEAKLLILFALDGPGALADAAGHTLPDAPSVPCDGPAPQGAFIKQIKVRGFRGIGVAAQLDLDPSPSLTVVSGRNGSGKSSFAEALEVALTGSTYRWRARTSQWKEMWRNVHKGDPAQIDVTLAEEGVGPTRVTLKWSPEAGLDEFQSEVTRNGLSSDAASLGWTEPLETYRPMLTYDELGALLMAEPKVLYDALSTVLGLERVTEAVKALDEHRKALVAPQLALKDQKAALERELSNLTDERAKRAYALVSAKSLDVAALRALASGTAATAREGSRLRELATLTFPDATTCRSVADELSESVGGLAAAGNRVSETLQRRSRLIEAAIALHVHEGDQSCPVCSTGTLDTARVTALRDELARDQSDLAELDDARNRHIAALRSARALLSQPATPLNQAIPDELAVLVSVLADAWTAWLDAPGDSLRMADHLRAQGEPVREALEPVRASAANLLAALDDAWGRVAGRLSVFADNAEEVAEHQIDAATATAAHKWLKANEIVLKNERVQPIADAARHIWAGLRQESNVDIAGLSLQSSSTRRHVRISASVDGEDAGALTVMSHGELQSLALALFLPRATMSESPFRFVVLDDPVQAMDPAKVDGLVGILLEIAKTRQVLVFSHDDRFASAVRRAPREVPVRLIEVTRAAGSKVSTSVTYSPAQRYLRDAFGIVKDEGLPDETLSRVLPGLLRLALEAQAREVFFGRQLLDGASLQQVEGAWALAMKTRERIALALSDPALVDTWLARSPHRNRALRAANAVHAGLDGQEPLAVCRDVEKTLKDLKSGAQ